MEEKNTISMQDIADELGISKVTVSKALNGKYGVSKELKEKILEMAEKYQYTLPDYGLRRTKRIGIILSERFNCGDAGKFYMSMYEQMISELRRVSCAGMMITPNAMSLAKDLETIKKKDSFDALVLLGILDPIVRAQVDAIDLPKIYVDIYDETHKSDSVVTENIYSAYEITSYLIEKGHTKIGFIGTVGATTSITDRYLGYMKGLLEKRIDICQEWIIPDRDEEGKAIALQLPETLPTAFMCNCDETAFRFVKLLKSKGISVPEEIAVVGFDNDIYAELCEPPLTTVAVNVEEIGRMTVKRVMKQIRNPQKKGKIYRIPGKIIFRDSVKD